MSEDVFRIVVTVAVIVASLAFVVQAGIMFALYLITRKAQGSAETFMTKMEPVLARVEPVVGKLEPMIDSAAGIIERAGPVIDQMKPVIARLGPTIDRFSPVIDQAVPVIKKMGPVIDEARTVVTRAGLFVERATDLAATGNLILQDARPQVAHISQEAAEITHIAREQVERVGDLLHDAGDKARVRLDQIDRSVDSTIEHVEQASDAVKRAVMKPVREVNGLAAGISAAMSTLVRGRQSSVDAATQDEEMFI